MITIARWFLISIGIAMIPAWKIWICCGWIADRHAQERTR